MIVLCSTGLTEPVDNSEQVRCLKMSTDFWRFCPWKSIGWHRKCWANRELKTWDFSTGYMFRSGKYWGGRVLQCSMSFIYDDKWNISLTFNEPVLIFPAFPMTAPSSQNIYVMSAFQQPALTLPWCPQSLKVMWLLSHWEHSSAFRISDILLSYLFNQSILDVLYFSSSTQKKFLGPTPHPKHKSTHKWTQKLDSAPEHGLYLGVRKQAGGQQQQRWI